MRELLAKNSGITLASANTTNRALSLSRKKISKYYIQCRTKKKGLLTYNLRMREAFEIRRHDSGPGKGLNEDNGAYLKTDMWDPILKAL